MPGIRNMQIGALCAIAGILITAITYFFSSIRGGGTYLIAYGAIVVGAIQFVIGFFQYIAYQAKTPEGNRRIHAEATAKTILRAMMVTAAADGVVSEHEIDSIAAIYKRLFGGVLEKDWISQTQQKCLIKILLTLIPIIIKSFKR
ncbi:DUF533 domain-containing protein [Thermodesulfobacteriota bacterium]